MRTKEEALAALRPIDSKFITEVQKQALYKLQLAVEEFAHVIYEMVPECADRTAAMRKLLECKMTCVQAITHTGFGHKSDHKEVKIDAKEKEKKEVR